MGLPGSGKTYLAERLQPLLEAAWYYADKVRGMDIVIAISSNKKEHSLALLEKLNFPFIKKGENQ